ncbi:MAG: hypothetical protein ACLTKZ_05860 [Lachnospiraceae bacterium]
MIEFFHRKFSIKGQLHFRKSHSVCLLPYPKASPCLHKILQAKFSSAKMFSRFVASPCLIVLAHNEAKIVSRFAASHRGEAVAESD